MEEDISTPLASIVIPAYNAAPCIMRAIHSLGNQRDIEIIVVDDCSTDKTAAIIEHAAALDARICLIRSEKNGGPSIARNKGFAAAKGEWIFILDADDAYRPNRVNTMINLAIKNGLDMICDNIMFHDIHAHQDVRAAHLPFKDRLTTLPLELFLQNSLYLPPILSLSRKQITQFALLKFCFRRSFIVASGVRYDKDYRDNEDFIFYAECLIAGAKAAVLSDPLYVYTQGIGEISREKSGLARTPRDRSLIVKAVKELIEKRKSSLGTVALKLLKRRAKEAEGMQAFERAMIELKQRRAGSAVQSLTRRPLAIQFFANEAIVVALRRIGV